MNRAQPEAFRDHSGALLWQQDEKPESIPNPSQHVLKILTHCAMMNRKAVLSVSQSFLQSSYYVLVVVVFAAVARRALIKVEIFPEVLLKLYMITL